MKFEKISVDLLTPKHSGLTLKNVVSLASSSPQQKKRNTTVFATTMTDTTGKYSDINQLHYLHVKRKEYLVFSAKSDEADSRKTKDVYFSHPNMWDLVSAFKRAASWCEEHFEKVYAEYEDGLCVVDKYNDAQITIENESGATISLQPAIIVEDDFEYCGIAIFVGDIYHCCNLTCERFLNLVYYLERFDLSLNSMSAITLAAVSDRPSPNLSSGKASQTVTRSKPQRPSKKQTQ